MEKVGETERSSLNGASTELAVFHPLGSSLASSLLSSGVRFLRGGKKLEDSHGPRHGFPWAKKSGGYFYRSRWKIQSG